MLHYINLMLFLVSQLVLFRKTEYKIIHSGFKPEVCFKNFSLGHIPAIISKNLTNIK